MPAMSSAFDAFATTDQQSLPSSKQNQSAGGLPKFGKYREIIFSAALFLLLDLVVLTVNFYTSFQITEDAVAINLAGRQRMLSQKVAKSLLSVEAASIKGQSIDKDLIELNNTVALFDLTLKGLQYGATVPGGNGEPVFLPAAHGEEATNILAQANKLWTPFQDRLAPVLAGSASPRQIQAADGYATTNNLELLALMNQLTSTQEAAASSHANMLRMVQTAGITLALLNFAFILLKFLRRLNRSDAELETARLADIRAQTRAQQEIIWINAGLEKRVQQRTAELEFANRELEAFSYSVSHDLRSPLSAVDGFSSLLDKTLDDEPSAKNRERSQHLIKRIRVGVVQMDEMIEGFLAMAQVSRMRLRSEPVNLSDIVQAELASLQERQPERTAGFAIEPDLVADGDPRLLKHVLSNLLGNAWKFSAAQTFSQISFGREFGDTGETVYFVRDNGAGFDMAAADKLFVAFQRLHSHSEFAGTGIGLATVQRIVERHGGRVWAQSSPGHGATFYFSLDKTPD